MYNKIYLLFLIIIILFIFTTYRKIEFFDTKFPFINWKINFFKKPCKKIIKINNNCIIYKNFFTSKKCDKIINISKKYDLDLDNDIDEKPLYQIDLFYDKKIYKKELFKHVCINKIRNLLNNIKLPENKKIYDLDFVFFRKYKNNERKSFTIHYDEDHVTTMILLSDKNNFKGGDFFLFDKNTSQEINYVDDYNTDEREQFIKNYKNLPKMDLDKGDLILFTSNQFHGTIDISSGVRYTLIFFWNIK